MSGLNCRQVRRILGQTRRADWSADTRLAVDEHLKACAPCRQESAALDLVGRAVGARRQATRAPEGFAGAVMSRVASREVARARRWALPALDMRSLRPAFAVAVVVVLVLTVAVVLIHRGPADVGGDGLHVADASQSFVDELVLSHQELASSTGADAGVLLTRYSPACP